MPRPSSGFPTNENPWSKILGEDFFQAMSGSWTYRRVGPDRDPGTEIGVPLSGREALGAHFHDEAQAVLVFVGERSILVRNELLTVRAGECLLIPPRIAHAPLPFEDSVVAVNLYSQAFPLELPPTVVKSPPRARALLERPASLVSVLAEYWREAAHSREGPGARLPQMEPTAVLVATLARRAAMSREAFTRAFHRAHGISPQAFLQGVRLNAARRLLKDGASPAAAAAAAGFADQSHLGRLFRRAFGTTPGRYRRD